MRLIKASDAEKEIARAKKRAAKELKQKMKQFAKVVIRHINKSIRERGEVKGKYYSRIRSSEEVVRYVVNLIRDKGYYCVYEKSVNPLSENLFSLNPFDYEYVIIWSLPKYAEDKKDE